jgi:hypothetical protein
VSPLTSLLVSGVIVVDPSVGTLLLTRSSRWSRACWSVRSLTVALFRFSRLLVTIVAIVGDRSVGMLPLTSLTPVVVVVPVVPEFRFSCSFLSRYQPDLFFGSLVLVFRNPADSHDLIL